MKRACVVVAMVAAMAALPAAAQTTLWVEDQAGNLLGQYIGGGTTLLVWVETGGSGGIAAVSGGLLERKDLHFEQSGCAGTALLGVWNSLPGGVEGPLLSVDGLGNLYRFDVKANPPDEAVGSYLNTNGTCQNTSFVHKFTAGTLVQAGFAAQFTPPFRIRAEAQAPPAPAAVSAVGPAGLAALAAVIAVLGAAVLVGRRLAA